MELALSLGDTSKPPFSYLGKTPTISSKDLGFCMGLGFSGRSSEATEAEVRRQGNERRVSSDPPLKLDLPPFSPFPRTQQPAPSHLRFPWLTDNLVKESGSTDGPGRGLYVNRLPVVMAAVMDDAEDAAALSSSLNSTVSSFQMDFGITSKGSGRSKRDLVEMDTERASERASDDEENWSTRKKLRLSKEQSAFLEESFKEHNTLNPKQKLALAKQLNLRPRQVEVWFQNRRARTKLKQTEVDCEYLKRCCETLAEENRRLQKEVQELRALKTSQPFYMQLPATTLTMCPSCEHVATATPTTSDVNNNAAGLTTSLDNPRLYPFSPLKSYMPQAQAHQTA